MNYNDSDNNFNNIGTEIKNNISNTINKIVDNIKKSPSYKQLEKSNLFKIRRQIDTSKNNYNDMFINYESKMIPADDYVKYLMFSLENFYIRTKDDIVKYISDFDLDPTKYIYYNRLNSYKELSGGINFKKALNCSIDVRIEYDEKILKYTDENGKFISFNYNIEDIDEDDDDDDDDDNDEDDKVEEDEINKKNTKSFIEFCDFLVKRIEKCGEFSTILLTNWTSSKTESSLKKYSSHRNIILIQNFKNEIVFNHYEPHGYSTDYYKDERNEFFEILLDVFEKSYQKYYLKESLKSLKKTQKKPKYKQIKIIPFNASICFGIQKQLQTVDVGYCSLFSFFWLYFVLTVYFELKLFLKQKNNEMFTINQIAPIFEKLLILKFKNDINSLYKIVITFSFKLFEDYLKSDLISNIDKSIFNDIQKLTTDDLWNKYPNLTVYYEKWNKKDLYSDSYYDLKSLPKISFKDIQSKEIIDSKLLDEEDKNIKKIFPTLYKPCIYDMDCKNDSLLCSFDEETNDKLCKHKNKNTLFSYCKNDYDCFSDNCLNNICKPYNEKPIKSIGQPIEIKYLDFPETEDMETEDMEIEDMEIENVDNGQEFVIENVDNGQEFVIENVDNGQEFVIENNI